MSGHRVEFSSLTLKSLPKQTQVYGVLGKIVKTCNLLHFLSALLLVGLDTTLTFLCSLNYQTSRRNRESH